jgi:hypothetical protein
MKKIIMLIALGLSVNAFASVEDLAIDPKSGDTVVIQRTENPSGEITFLNDKNLGFKQVLKLLPFPSEGAKFEVELNKKNKVTYLVQVNKNWFLGTIEKLNNVWTVSSHNKGLNGQGLASNLTTLPDGNLALTLKENDKEIVALVKEDKGALSILEELDAQEVKDRAIDITNEENNYLLRTSLECEGDNCRSEEHVLSQAGLGFAAGATSGLGISYRKHLANKIGYQITGIGWGNDSNLFISMGANFMKTLHATKRTRFMAIAGVSAYYRTSNEIDWSDCREVSQEEWDANPNIDPCEGVDSSWRHGATINVGVGIGMEFMLTQNVGLALELPVVVMIGIGESSGLGIYPIPNASLIYYF